MTATLEYINPVDPSTRTQGFGDWPNPEYQKDGHTGEDFGVPVGTPVRAIADGTVLHADWASKLGWPNPYYVAIDFDGPANGDQSAGIIIIIDHGPGKPLSIYAHLDQTGLNPGDKVRQGEIIGQTGNTGRSSGPHLHFEMLPDGWNVHAKWYGRVNPRNFIKTKAFTVPAKTPPKAVIKLDDLTPAEQREILLKVRDLHRDYSFGISGVRSDGDIANFFRRIGQKLGVSIDEAKRKANYKK